MGYFKKVNFIFLIVGHTKNAADCLFNSMKQIYRKRNIYTMDQLVAALETLTLVTIHQTVAEDFLDYSKVFDTVFSQSLMGNVKQNHIFSCSHSNGFEMTLRQSNLEEHSDELFSLRKRGTWAEGVTWADLVEIADKELKPIPCVGLNPYKLVEMWNNFRPLVSFWFVVCGASRRGLGKGEDGEGWQIEVSSWLEGKKICSEERDWRYGLITIEGVDGWFF
jgi:hypothetical protein